jgi:regulator of replication initiation timing
MIGRVAITAIVKDGTLRDAKLHAAGANGTHGLQRTNADKRHAVTMLLSDPEWVQWSDREIARACRVSHNLVADVRASLTGISASETPVERTYTTRHGTQAAMQTAKIGKTKPAPAPIPANSGELKPAANDTQPTIATPRLTPEQGQVAVTEVDALVQQLAERDALIAELREELDDIKADMAETLDDNNMMTRVFEADDQLKAALMEVARYRAVAEHANRTLAARAQEYNERARLVVYWKKRAEKAEKLLASAEATSAPSALRDEIAQLRAENSDLGARLEDLAVQLQEAMTCHDEMHKILEASVPLGEMPQQLYQVMELSRMLEIRVAEAPRCYAEAQCEQDGVTQSVEDEAVVHGEHFTGLTGTGSPEYEPSNADNMVQAAAEGEPGVELNAVEVPEDD